MNRRGVFVGVRSFAVFMFVPFCLLLIACGGGGGEGGSATPSIPGRTYGGTGDDYAWSVRRTTDNGFVFAGFTNSKGAGGYDAWVVRIDPSGNVIREATFGSSGNDFAFSIQQTPDGGYIVVGVDNEVAGRAIQSGIGLPLDFSGELTLRKLDGDLSLTWEKKFADLSSAGHNWPYSMGYAIEQTADGGYVVAGAGGNGGGGGQTLLLKTDPGGVPVWTLFLDGEIGTDVRETTDHGYVVTDVSTVGVPSLVKVSSGGTIAWSQTFSGVAYAVWNSRDGGFAVTGLGPGPSGDVLFAKTTSGGAIQWDNTLGGSPGGDLGFSIQQTSDDGYVLAGAGSGGGDNHGFDVYVAKTNSVGTTLWERYFGGSGDDVGRSVRQTSDDGYIVAGSTTSIGAGGVDAYLVKTDSAGAPLW